MVDLIILTNSLLVIITGVYSFLTYKILKSNEKIEKIRLDPILWVNPFAEADVYITKMRKCPAYNISLILSIKFPEEKHFNKLIEYSLGSLIEKEETYNINIENSIEEFLKKKNKIDSKFIIKYVVEYYIGIDNKPIRRADYLYYHSEEYEGEIMLGASTDKETSLDGGKSPNKIIKYY